MSAFFETCTLFLNANKDTTKVVLKAVQHLSEQTRWFVPLGQMLQLPPPCMDIV